MSNVIAIASEKGGVAKTTTALSLGGALVESGQDVLMVDLDPQASLTLSLGIPPHTIRRSIADVLLNSVSPVSVSRQTVIPGLDLVPSNGSLELAERFLPVRRNYRTILRDILREIQLYDTVVIDCPPSLGAVTANAIVAADLLCVPTIPEYLSVYSLRNVLNLIRTVREKNNPKLKYRILVTMLDKRIKSHLALNEQIRSTFKDAVFKTIIQVDTRLRDAAIAGYPITHFATKSRSALQYRALVEELGHYVRSEKVKQAA